MPRVSGTSRVLVVLGDPVRHSLSPAMQNAAITALGLDAVYVPLALPAKALAGFLATAADLNVAGNVTVPHKVAAAAHVGRRTPLADRLGAINTFWPEKGVLVGDNTDVEGVLDALQHMEAAGPWLVAGTGGSARAVAAAAGDRGVEILVRSRDPERAKTFVSWAVAAGVKARADDGTPVATVINATPLGLAIGDALPVPLDRLKGCKVALDLVYTKGETKWVTACRARGMRSSDGRVTLVAQGMHAFERFFPGTTAPREVMMAAVEEGLR